MSKQEDTLNKAFGSVPKDVCWYVDIFEERPPRQWFVWYHRVKQWLFNKK